MYWTVIIQISSNIHGKMASMKHSWNHFIGASAWNFDHFMEIATHFMDKKLVVSAFNSNFIHTRDTLNMVCCNFLHVKCKMFTRQYMLIYTWLYTRWHCIYMTQDLTVWKQCTYNPWDRLCNKPQYTQLYR